MHKAISKTLFTSFLALGGLTLASAASAQSVGEITVMGRLGPDGQAAELSAPVSYADLDLTRPGDADILKMRVKDTAKDLCSRLGERNASSLPLVPTCEQAARDEAMKQVEVAINTAVPRTMPPSAMAAPMGASVAATDVSTTATVTPAASYTVTSLTNGPVPDTAENRARLGGPMSRAGKHTAPAGN